MYKRIERAAANLSGILLFVLMLVTFVDVLGRNLLNRPLNGASELTEILLALVIFLMLPHVTLRGQHIVIDIIANAVSSTVLAVLDALAALLSATMFFLIAWQSWRLADKAMGYGDSTATLGIPLGPVLYGLAVLSGIVGLAALLSIPLKRLEAAAPQGEHEPVIV
jgi:TRAP-type C4-dicarboxylate transport system permease small subunit